MEASYSEVGVLIELSFGKKFEIVGKWAGLNAKQKEIRKYHTPLTATTSSSSSSASPISSFETNSPNLDSRLRLR